MADSGYRSFTHFWLGGSWAAGPPPPAGGYCSFFGMWMGGVCAPGTEARVVLQASHWWGPMEQSLQQAGYRSLFGRDRGG